MKRLFALLLALYMGCALAEEIYFPADDAGFVDGLAIVRNADGLLGVINEAGEEVSWFGWDEIRRAGEGLFWMKLDGLWLPVGSDGVQRGNHGFSAMADFESGYAAVQDASGLWGVIDVHNRRLIPCRYAALENLGSGMFRADNGSLLDAADVARRWPADCVIVDIDPESTGRRPQEEGSWVIVASWSAARNCPMTVDPVTVNRAQALGIDQEKPSSLLRGAAIIAWENETAAGAFEEMAYLYDERGSVSVAGFDGYYGYKDAWGTLTLYIDTERSAALCIYLYMRGEARPGAAAMLAEAETLLSGLTLARGE